MKTRDCEAAQVCCQDCPSMRDARKHDWASHHNLLAETKTGKPVCLSIASFSLLSPDQRFLALAHVFWETANVAEGAADAASDSVGTPHSPPSGSAQVSPVLFLSRQEQNVLRCLAAGMDTAAIAGVFFISPVTVRNHIQNILRKLGVHSRLEAVALANHRRWT